MRVMAGRAGHAGQERLILIRNMGGKAVDLRKLSGPGIQPYMADQAGVRRIADRHALSGVVMGPEAAVTAFTGKLRVGVVAKKGSLCGVAGAAVLRTLMQYGKQSLLVSGIRTAVGIAVGTVVAEGIRQHVGADDAKTNDNSRDKQRESYYVIVGFHVRGFLLMD